MRTSIQSCALPFRMPSLCQQIDQSVETRATPIPQCSHVLTPTPIANEYGLFISYAHA